MQTSDRNPMFDRVRGEAEVKQLPTSHHAMLLPDERPYLC
jgi:hypothetical protein